MRPLSLKRIKVSPLTDWDTTVKNEKILDENVIALNVGQPNFLPPLVLNEAIIRATKLKGINFYTSPGGSEEVRVAVSLFHKDIFDIKYPINQICIMNGAKEGIFASVGAIIDGDEVIIVAPYWSTYVEVTKLWNGIPVIVNSDKNFHLDIEGIKKAITLKTKAIIINTPSNPTGVIYTEKELRQLAELVVDNDLYVISDEIYAITYKNHFSIASIKGMKERTIVVNGFSKVLSVTGYRIGYLASSKAIIDAILKIKSNSSGNTNSLMQVAIADILMNSFFEVNTFIREINLILTQRRNFFCARLSKLGIEYHNPEGAFYVFAKIPKKFQMRSREFSEYLLKKTKIAVTPGIFFGEDYDDYVRVAFSSSEEELVEALNRMSIIMNNREMI